MINRKLVETPVKMMNRMEEITDLICEYNEEVQKQQQEIERLNNIINELEKYINEQIQKSWEIEEQCYETIYSKLQELKGSDSNE